MSVMYSILFLYEIRIFHFHRPVRPFFKFLSSMYSKMKENLHTCNSWAKFGHIENGNKSLVCLKVECFFPHELRDKGREGKTNLELKKVIFWTL